MARARARTDLPGASVAAAEGLWYDTDSWPAWVDGLARVLSVEGAWPSEGATVVWESTPGGRGRVTERVVEHEAGRGQELAVADGQVEGTQRVAFAALEGGVEVALELEYRLLGGGPLRAVLDLLFIRRAWNDSLRRTLAAFERELADRR